MNLRAALLLLMSASLIPADYSAAVEGKSTQTPRRETSDALHGLADEYLAIERLDEAGSLPKRDDESLERRYRAQDEVLERLKLIDPAGSSDEGVQTEYSILMESFESRRALRVCHTERWDLNHIMGWQVRLPQQLAEQPTASAADRERALKRWASLPAYVEIDIGNLKAGLASGYSVPDSVVRRVLRQVESLAATTSESDGPLDRPAGRSNDAAFQRQWRELVADAIAPSIRRFAEFLRNEYLPHARASIGLWDLPEGKRCYAALLRSETTLNVSAEATFNLGQATAARSESELKRLGAALFGTSDVKEILKRAKSAPDNRFSSPDSLVAYANHILSRSIRMSAPYFIELPRQAIEIEPLPAYQQGSGISSHYEAVDSISRVAVYRINLDHWQEQTRGAIAVTAVHEGVPGHHLQREAARRSPLAGSIGQLAYNSAYVEGWANYVERLCETMEVYDNPYSAIFRRSVLGQSLIIDPAIHAKRWNRERARKYLRGLGQSDQEAEDLIDRIAVQPAQLTSYEYGGFEFARLSARVKSALGSRFDIREFHQRVLEYGPIPLATLRVLIEEWMASAGG